MNAVTRLVDFDDRDFDPFIADELMFGACLDPYPKLAALRAKGSVHHLTYREYMGEPADHTQGHLDHYTVVGYDEVQRCLNEPETFSNEAYKLNLGISFGRSVSTMDPPEHGRYRKIFQKAFLPQTVAKWGESVVDPVVQGLMGKFRNRGAADLVQEFTLHYPFQIVYKHVTGPVGAPPAITVQPRDTTATVGLPVSLSVTASGAGGLGWAWIICPSPQGERSAEQREFFPGRGRLA